MEVFRYRLKHFVGIFIYNIYIYTYNIYIYLCVMGSNDMYIFWDISWKMDEVLKQSEISFGFQEKDKQFDSKTIMDRFMKNIANKQGG